MAPGSPLTPGNDSTPEPPQADTTKPETLSSDSRLKAEVEHGLRDLSPEDAELVRKRFGLGDEIPKTSFQLALEQGAKLPELFDTMKLIDGRSDDALRSLMGYGSRAGASQAVRVAELAEATAFLTCVAKTCRIDPTSPLPISSEIPESANRYISQSLMHSDLLTLDEALREEIKALLSAFHSVIESNGVDFPPVVKLSSVYQILVQRLVAVHEREGLAGDEAVRSALFP